VAVIEVVVVVVIDVVVQEPQNAGHLFWMIVASSNIFEVLVSGSQSLGNPSEFSCAVQLDLLTPPHVAASSGMPLHSSVVDVVVVSDTVVTVSVVVVVWVVGVVVPVWVTVLEVLVPVAVVFVSVAVVEVVVTVCVAVVQPPQRAGQLAFINTENNVNSQSSTANCLHSCASGTLPHAPVV
jgi:hypothetical protein